MITYPIGAPAEKLVSLRLDRNGTITPILRRRQADGTLVSAAGQAHESTSEATDASFIVRVEPGHSGVVEILPVGSRSPQARTIIPLGASRPFLESEFPPSPGADGAFSQSETISFHFSENALTWVTENMSGQIEFTRHKPAVSVTLRLPAGNDGEITFPRTNGRHICKSSPP